jgi:hypothetical protein
VRSAFASISVVDGFATDRSESAAIIECVEFSALRHRLWTTVLEAVIGKILTHLGLGLGLEPQPRSKAREAGHEFAA